MRRVAVLLHDAARVELLAEDLRGEADQLRRGLRVAPGPDGRRGADEGEAAGCCGRPLRGLGGGSLGGLGGHHGRRHFQPLFQSPDEARHVAALGPVIGVQLVQDQVAQRVRPVAGPQRLVLGPKQQEVQHPVVGQQDVRRRGAQDLPVVDQVVGPRGPVHPLAADVEPRRHLPLQKRVRVQQLRQPTGLVIGQGVHRVEQDGFDAPLVPVPPAVVQDGVEEALRLPRARARGDQRVLRDMPRSRGQPPERNELVRVGREGRRDLERDLLVRHGLAEGQAHVDERALQQALGPLQEVEKPGLQLLVREVEGSLQVVQQGGLELGGEDGAAHCSVKPISRW